MTFNFVIFHKVTLIAFIQCNYDNQVYLIYIISETIECSEDRNTPIARTCVTILKGGHGKRSLSITESESLCSYKNMRVLTVPVTI